MTAAPVRVTRKGPLKWFHPSREELRQACLYAESEAKQIRFEDDDHFLRWVMWCVGEQLGCGITATIAGYHDINDTPVVRIVTEHYEHHIAARGVRIQPRKPSVAETALQDPVKFAQSVAKEVAKLLPAGAKVR